MNMMRMFTLSVLITHRGTLGASLTRWQALDCYWIIGLTLLNRSFSKAMPGMGDDLHRRCDQLKRWKKS